MGQVSVEAALRRGSLLLKVVPLVVIMLFLVAPFVVIEVVDVHIGLLVVSGLLGGVVVGWLWWSLAVTRWRIWAYTHVRNIHELIEVAVAEKLVWPKGHFFERTEIRTKAQRELLQQLEARFATPDEQEDDPTVPARTVVRYARVQLALLITWGLAMIGFAVHLFYSEESPWVALFIAGIGVWITADGWRKLLRKRPVLVIDGEGITLDDGLRLSWGRVSSTKVVTRGSGRSTRQLLEVHHGGDRSELEIGSLDISRKGLRHALKIHRFRWAQQRGGPGVPTFVA